MGWQAVVLSILVLLNVTATVAVARSDAFSPAQQAWQLGLIWLVPLIGAVVCFLLAKIDASQADLSPPPHNLAPAGTDGVLPDFVPTICGCGGGADGGD